MEYDRRRNYRKKGKGGWFGHSREHAIAARGRKVYPNRRRYYSRYHRKGRSRIYNMPWQNPFDYGERYAIQDFLSRKKGGKVNLYRDVIDRETGSVRRLRIKTDLILEDGTQIDVNMLNDKQITNLMKKDLENVSAGKPGIIHWIPDDKWKPDPEDRERLLHVRDTDNPNVIVDYKSSDAAAVKEVVPTKAKGKQFNIYETIPRYLPNGKPNPYWKAPSAEQWAAVSLCNIKYDPNLSATDLAEIYHLAHPGNEFKYTNEDGIDNKTRKEIIIKRGGTFVEGRGLATSDDRKKNLGGRSWEEYKDYVKKVMTKQELASQPTVDALGRLHQETRTDSLGRPIVQEPKPKKELPKSQKLLFERKRKHR